MTLDLRGFDSWRTTPPADDHNEYAEEDAMEREHAEHMAALKVWLENATSQQLRMAGGMLESERLQRLRNANAELKELGEPKPRAPRKDKGKPRLPKALPANETQPADPDPFAAEVSR